MVITIKSYWINVSPMTCLISNGSHYVGISAHFGEQNFICRWWANSTVGTTECQRWHNEWVQPWDELFKNQNLSIVCSRGRHYLRCHRTPQYFHLLLQSNYRQIKLDTKHSWVNTISKGEVMVPVKHWKYGCFFLFLLWKSPIQFQPNMVKSILW